MMHIFTWKHKNASGQTSGEIKRFIDETGNKQDIPYYIPNKNGGFDAGTTGEMKIKGNPLFGLIRSQISLSPYLLVKDKKCK